MIDIDKLDLNTMDGRLDYILYKMYENKKWGVSYSMDMNAKDLDHDLYKLYPYKDKWDTSNDNHKHGMMMAARENYISLQHQLRLDGYFDVITGMQSFLSPVGDRFVEAGGYTEKAKQEKILADKGNEPLSVAKQTNKWTIITAITGIILLIITIIGLINGIAISTGLKMLLLLGLILIAYSIWLYFSK